MAYVKNKTDIMQNVLKMKQISLLPQCKKWIFSSAF